MYEKTRQQVYGVLEKYDKSYSNSSMNANLQAWQNNKGWLAELLRRHPNWNEDALAVVLEVTHSREIDKSIVNLYKYELSKLITELEVPEDDRTKFVLSLDAIAFTYAKTLPGAETAAIVKKHCGITCSVGQKTSRIINAICKKYGVDKHPEYNARFAKLADALNPLLSKRTALLSVHPCDYLEMSNRKNSWSSCQCLDGGEYHGGTLSYMNDECSMVFYTIDDDVTEAFHTVPKRTRQIFCFHSGILMQSRLYPQTDDEDTREMYRNIVQQIIADCLMVPNLWMLKRNQEEISRRISTHENALHYRDYEYECYKANLSLLKNANVGDYDSICIGHTAYCIDCSEAIYDANSLYCDRCSDDGYITCYDCDHRVPEEDARYIDGHWYCEECCSYCEHCQEYTSREMTEVYGRQDYSYYVCQDCLDNYYHCGNCGDYFHEDKGQQLDDGFCCDDCLETNYSICDRCGEYVRNDETEEIDGTYYCKNCVAEIRSEMEEVTDWSAAS